MYLDEIVSAQKRGESRGIVSICSAHPWVLKAALQCTTTPLLIEATCNQVNQFGGYTGMTPADFVRYLREMAKANNFSFERMILGGDHLGPSVWQDEPAESAMQKADKLVQAYVEAGFTKIHLDCSMRLADDPAGALDVEVSAGRAARLAQVAENSLSHREPPRLGREPVGARRPSGMIRGRGEGLRYVIGTEVPIPGGAKEHEEGVSVTMVEDARQTIEVTRDAFSRARLESAWERVIALVVQPGVEFGDDFILPYQPEAAWELSKFIESQPMVYEAHSTDYQTRQALEDLVRDHFAILKVGPALTFALREAVFTLAAMEDELFPSNDRSNIISVLDDVMREHPEHWRKYYHGIEEEQAFKRKYSLSDRIRYYWAYPMVRQAFEKMMGNLNQAPLPETLLKQFVPGISSKFTESSGFTAEKILLAKIQNVLEDYAQACTQS